MQKDKKLAIGEYSHKMAAVRAGLGWIGKNALLITKGYGPRVRLATILVNLDLPVSKKVDYDGCGSCNLCVNICPTNCIVDVNWSNGLKREDKINIFNCIDKNESREGHICGLCLVVCPVGGERWLI
jgi:epoxyqueuosine reductase QueG